MQQRKIEKVRMIHPISYSDSPRDKRNRLPRVHQQRDIHAMMYVQSALFRMGYELGESILNPWPERPGVRPPNLRKVEIPFVEPGSIVLQTTRPPISDDDHGDRKRLERAWTDLEQRLIDVWCRYLACCARSHVILKDFLHDELPGRYRNHRQMVFREAGGAPYKELNFRKLNPDERRTAAFLVRVEEAWPGGPGYIGAFGMDGIANLVWAYRLAHDQADLLQDPGFVVAELENTTGIPDRPTDMRWMHDWKVNVLFHHTGAVPHHNLVLGQDVA